jgi:uncharacterized membrane protein HdeD (DUF308 family)
MSSLSPMSSAAALLHERTELHKHWLLFFVLGLVSVIVGFLAISSSFVVTMASVFVFGVLLLIAGATEVIHAVMVRNLKGFALHLLAAAMYLFAGLFMLEDPIRAAAVVTLLIAASFLVGGTLRIIFAIAVQFHAWPWVVLNGLVDLILGVMIWREWPESSLWVIGLFVGIDLFLHGWSWMMLALSVRTLPVAPAV